MSEIIFDSDRLAQCWHKEHRPTIYLIEAKPDEKGDPSMIINCKECGRESRSQIFDAFDSAAIWWNLMQ